MLSRTPRITLFYLLGAIAAATGVYTFVTGGETWNGVIYVVLAVGWVFEATRQLREPVDEASTDDR
ncbi:hypothetical protein [Citricoccus sp. GCM10030269]|uniref:hypothetical protein n=1 Tax=Citricoccus sp. GCM10030269 TaxID=3273388 RepID=UPI003612E579